MILVTGVTGFIGKHLLDALVKKYGANHIVALTSRPTGICPYLLHDNYNFDKDYFIKSGFDAIDTIIHVGAFIPKSGKDVNSWLECNSNIVNTGKLLMATLPNLSMFVFLSTVDIYGDDEVVSEQTPLVPVSLYGNSKLYCEKMIAAWGEANQKQYQILRVGHVYGPGEEAYKKVIPVTIRKLLNNESLEIWGTGREIRAFIYIKDVVQAILQSLEISENNGPINLVSNQQISIRELVEKLISISGQNSTVEIVANNVPPRNLIFDSSKMNKILLPSETSLDIGLKEEWEYVKATIK
jgi:nucleoside-diphosphate-sugar epimerase